MKAHPETTWPFVQIKPFLNYLVSECGLSANTISAYSRDLDRFGRYCRKEQVRDATRLTPR